MTPLAEFLDILLHGLELITLGVVVGGAVVTLAVLQPWQPLTIMGRIGLQRSAHLIMVVGGIFITTHIFRLALQFSALGDGPMAQFLATDFARAGIIRIIAILGIIAVSWFWLSRRPTSLTGWIVLALLAGWVVVAGAWWVQGAGRGDGQGALVAIIVLHQLAAVVWVGATLHLLLLWRLLWGNLEAAYLWPRWVARFSPVVLGSVLLLIVAGVYLALSYVGSWQGLMGTSYGIMVLAKVVLLLLALAIVAVNFSQIRRWQKQREATGVLRTLPPFLGAESWVLAIALLSAAALTALPPAVDIPERQASFTEVAEHFMPRVPRLVPPSREEYSAAASSVYDIHALPVAIERAQSEFNHNFSGAVVLVMALLALVDRGKFLVWTRHWPLLFLGLGVFLFLFAVATVWPLGSESFWKTLQVPAVLQHRLFTLLVIALGWFEWRVRTGKLTHPHAVLVFPLLCIVGGALLLTHFHTGLPLKSEFLIEAYHAVLGVLAVVMGVGRWLELRLEAAHSYRAGWVWRVSFVLVGLLLLFYSEPPGPDGYQH